MIPSPANPLGILWNCHWKFDQISMPVDTVVHLFGCLNSAPHAVYKLSSKEMHHISNVIACLIFICPFTFISSGFKSEIWPRTGLALPVFNGVTSWKRLLSLPLIVSKTKVPIIIFWYLSFINLIPKWWLRNDFLEGIALQMRKRYTHHAKFTFPHMN